MAAPSSAYQTEKLNFDSTTTEIDASLAKFLQNTTATTGDEWGNGYFNSGDSDATIKTKILSIFKLDELLRGYKTDKTGFVGMIKISPSVTTNYAYHSTSRLNGRRIIDAATGNVYDIFTDAGLNTRGYSELGNNTNEAKWANWINLAFYVRSSFYDNSSGVGYSWSVNGGSWTDVSFGYTAPSAKEVLSGVFRHIDLTPSVSEGSTVGLRAWVTNPEGTTYSSEYSFTALELLAIPTGANIYDAPDGDIIDSVTVYMLATTEADLPDVTTTDTATGLYLYNSEYFTTGSPSTGDIVANGWYVIGGVPNLPNGNIKVFQVVSGQVRKYTERVLSVATILFNCVNVGEIDFPIFRGQATILDDTTPATGFLQTVSTSVTVYYLDASNNILESYSAGITITQGNTTAVSSIVSPPPPEAIKVQVICAANEATLGMPKSEPITSLPPM